MANDFYTNDGRLELIAIDQQLTYDFDFPIYHVDDLEVWHDGGLLPLTRINLANDGLSGTVTLPNPIPAGDNIVITRSIKAVRATEFRQDGYITAALLNREFDKIYNILGQEQRELERNTLITRENDTDATLPLPEADMVLGWDSTGSVLENKGKADHTHPQSSVTNLTQDLEVLRAAIARATSVQEIVVSNDRAPANLSKGSIWMEY